MKYFLPEFRPKKSFGQNFLKNPRVVEKIIAAAAISPNDLVVEVGPGFGVLTEALLQKARRVIAIEKDVALYTHLKEKFRSAKNLELFHADALKVSPPREPYLLVANIPYSITSPLLDHFIREQPENLPKRAVFLVQKEVAQKICAKPPDMNVLALHIQSFGAPKIIAYVSKNNFEPRPKVDSAVIKIEFEKEESRNRNKEYEKYFSLIHAAFAQRRKMLRAVFPKELLARAGIDGTRRPETLSTDEWWRLTAVA